jgi:ferredoxin
VRCVQVRLGKPDHVGRRDLTEQPDTDEIIPCDTVIDAAYFAPDGSWGSLSGGPWKNIQVNLDTMATSRPGVFAAGDVVSGPKSVVEAVALGHRAAAGIERYLAGDEKPVGTLSTPIRTRSWAINDPARTPSDAYRPSVRPPDARKNDFQESELPFTAWQATHEARRCLMCGPCEECAVCIPSCDRKRGAARGESGERLMVRVPLAVARSVAEEGEPAATEGMALYIARVDPERCRGCGVCEEICEYCAPRVAPDSHDRFTAAIDILACKGCGTCVAACPSGAIDQGVTSLHAMREMIIGGVR